MTTYVIRRLVIMVPLLLGITMINFAIFASAPGDPTTAMIDPQELAMYSPEQLEARRESLGLNKPIPVRYALWLGQVLRGNLGFSAVLSYPVSDLLWMGLKNTFGILAISLVLETIIGTALGVIAAVKRHSFIDRLLTTFAFAGASMPGFFFAMVLIYVGALRLGLFPTGGIVGAQGGGISDRLLHMVLPALALSLDGIGGLLRYTRASVTEAIDQDYITTARSKGLKNRVVLFTHAFRNGLLPLITIFGLRMPSLFGGAVLIESVFNYPGIGYTLFRATTTRDYPLLMGGVLITATAVLIATLIADIAYGWADPRIRY